VDRAFSDTDVLSDADFDALVCEGAGEGRGFFHPWELLCCIHIEWSGVYRFAMPDIVPHHLE
jgi:hypothetical protein